MGQRTNQWLPGLGGGGGLTAKGNKKEFFGGVELFCILSVVVITSIYACVKIHRTVCQEIDKCYCMYIGNNF